MSRVVALPSVTAPNVSASLLLAIVPFSVTVPPTPVVLRPPLNVCVPAATPSVSVPVLAKFTTFVTDEPRVVAVDPVERLADFLELERDLAAGTLGVPRLPDALSEGLHAW